MQCSSSAFTELQEALEAERENSRKKVEELTNELSELRNNSEAQGEEAVVHLKQYQEELKNLQNRHEKESAIAKQKVGFLEVQLRESKA